MITKQQRLGWRYYYDERRDTRGRSKPTEQVQDAERVIELLNSLEEMEDAHRATIIKMRAAPNHWKVVEDEVREKCSDGTADQVSALLTVAREVGDLAVDARAVAEVGLAWAALQGLYDLSMELYDNLHMLEQDVDPRVGVARTILSMASTSLYPWQQLLERSRGLHTLITRAGTFPVLGED